MSLRRLHGPQQSAEAAAVVEAQALTTGQHQIDVIVFLKRSVCGQDAQPARHTEVDDRGAGIGAQQQVLGAPVHLLDDLTREGRLEFLRHRPAQPGLPHPHLGHDLTGEMRRDAAPDGFDFGQFGP